MMKKLLSFTFIIISLYVVSCQKPPSAVKIEFIVDLFSGSVDMSGDKGQTWKAVQVGMKLGEGDSLRTGRDSFCDVIMPDRGVFRLSGLSVLTLEQLRIQMEKIRVGKGRLFASITKPLAEGEDFLVETSTAVVSVRGTEFLVDTDGDKTVTSVKKGRVSVRKNVRTGAEGVLDDGAISRLLEVPVGENENLEVDTAGNRRLEERIVRRMKGVKNPGDAEKILTEEKRSALKEVRKVRDVRALEKGFRELNDPEKIRRLRDESERFRRDRMQQEKRLEENLKEIKQKARLKDIAGQKVGESATTAEEDIRSGEADRAASGIRQKLRERSAGLKESETNASLTNKGLRDSLRERTRKALDRNK